jgi:hypothetical protein
MSDNGFEFWVNVNDGQNQGTLQVKIETQTGNVVALVIRDRETFEPLARLHLPEDACNLIGQALMLASTAKAGEH